MDLNNEKKAIIELQGICKSFSVGKRTAKVLKGIDLSINNGEMTAIIMIQRRKPRPFARTSEG